MQTALVIIQIVAAVLLVFVILVQEKGSGLGEAIAGGSASSFQTSKRGAEKVLSQITVGLLVLFLLVSLALNFV